MHQVVQQYVPLLLGADNLIIPTITELCAHIGVPNSTVGIIIGCCDIATIPATMGALDYPYNPWKAPPFEHLGRHSLQACVESLPPMSSESSCCVHAGGRLPVLDLMLAWFAGYSVWTNHDYKSPLIASGLACLIGNLAYCLSYDWNAVWLLFLARLITGFGEPRLLRQVVPARCNPEGICL